MATANYKHFNFGARLNDCIHEIFHHGGVTRTEADLTDGQRAFLMQCVANSSNMQALYAKATPATNWSN